MFNAEPSLKPSQRQFWQAFIMDLVAQGNLAIGRDFAAELERWFPGHADYLDSALAAWMCKRQFGGKPVVLHARKAHV